MKILVVAGHPADMFDHCGGTLLKHLKNGDEVTCVSMTQGLRVHDEVISDVFRERIDQFTTKEIEKIIQERQKVKHREVVEACKLFGITDIRFLSYDDEILTVTPDMISKLAKMIREVRPDIIITHWPYQNGGISDHHAVTGQITHFAIEAASGVNFEDKYPASRTAQLFYMLCPTDLCAYDAIAQGRTARITHLVDVTDVIDLKVKAIATMRSQKYDTPGYAKKTAEQWNGNFGIRVRLPYAEGFMAAKAEVYDLLPVSDHLKWLARADEHELLRRTSKLQAMDVDVQERE